MDPLGSIPKMSLLDVLRDFTTINNSIYHSTNSSIKDTIKKCRVLETEQVLYIRKMLVMNQIRSQKSKSGKILNRKTKSQIRFLITDALKRYPTLSYSQLSKETGLAFSTIQNFVNNDSYLTKHICDKCGAADFNKQDFKTKNVICVKPIGNLKEGKVCNSYTTKEIIAKDPEQRLLKVAKTGNANYVSLRNRGDFL